ncbi:MAG: hypothetical protein NC299_01170 [Lachnospiraceae bacterium]|nr:hypothetical protein [Ruminococcus sp.]MCM1273959.1 hypothetical protein [Lachnospiraceae bacterium]
MKRKFVILAALCVLLAGCSDGSAREPITVNYSDMFARSQDLEEVTVQRELGSLYTSAQDAADTPLGDVCYLPYKQRDDKKTKYNVGYRAVFRTSSDTYLLGVFPSVTCKWEDLNDECEKLGKMLDAECTVVGAPSLEDLEFFNSAGVYIPGRYEMWTATLADESKAFYRNAKGSYESSRSIKKKCGLCVLIKITAQQSDAELLTPTDIPGYEAAKTRLEEEEKQYADAVKEAEEAEK